MEQVFVSKHICIIDPTSTEFNRGSFCYAPYLCYNGLREMGYKVTLLEGFKAEDLDTISKADVCIVSLWSYPQIELALLLRQNIPFADLADLVYFVGYKPLINHLGLMHIEQFLEFDPLEDSGFLYKAMQTYPKYYGEFSNLLLSDCDMHIKELEKGHAVHPLFTSYGCPYGCNFCPSTVNCNKKRIVLGVLDTFTLLDTCLEKNVRYIHFTDEDFFFNVGRAYEILSYLKGKRMHLIALSSSKALLNFIRRYGPDVIADAGLEVIEIGFESAEGDLACDMGAGKSTSACLELAEMQHHLPFTIFWLVQTFFKGETISSLNETGRFMKKYGLDSNEVVGRLRTNGTVGGLGQFFQPYHGTPIYDKLKEEGLFLTTRPIRLMPSYIPDSFLDCQIQKVNYENATEAMKWVRLYNIDSFVCSSLQPGETLRQYIEGQPMWTQIKISILFAILARMEVIS